MGAAPGLMDRVAMACSADAMEILRNVATVRAVPPTPGVLDAVVGRGRDDFPEDALFVMSSLSGPSENRATLYEFPGFVLTAIEAGEGSMEMRLAGLVVLSDLAHFFAVALYRTIGVLELVIASIQLEGEGADNTIMEVREEAMGILYTMSTHVELVADLFMEEQIVDIVCEAIENVDNAEQLRLFGINVLCALSNLEMNRAVMMSFGLLAYMLDAMEDPAIAHGALVVLSNLSCCDHNLESLCTPGLLQSVTSHVRSEHLQFADSIRNVALGLLVNLSTLPSNCARMVDACAATLAAAVDTDPDAGNVHLALEVLCNLSQADARLSASQHVLAAATRAISGGATHEIMSDAMTLVDTLSQHENAATTMGPNVALVHGLVTAPAFLRARALVVVLRLLSHIDKGADVDAFIARAAAEEPIFREVHELGRIGMWMLAPHIGGEGAAVALSALSSREALVRIIGLWILHGDAFVRTAQVLEAVTNAAREQPGEAAKLLLRFANGDANATMILDVRVVRCAVTVPYPQLMIALMRCIPNQREGFALVCIDRWGPPLARRVYEKVYALHPPGLAELSAAMGDINGRNVRMRMRDEGEGGA